MQSQHSHSRPRRGFTMIELLMVVAVLAILATFIVPMFTGVENSSAEKVGIANQSAVNRTVQAYLLLNDGGLSDLDALVDWGTTIDTASAGSFAAADTLNDEDLVGGLYHGVKWTSFGDQTTADSETRLKNTGICDDLANELRIYYLSADDVDKLQRLGLTHVLYMNPTGLHASSRGGYDDSMSDAIYGSDGVEIVSSGPAFRVEHAASFKIPLQEGLAVAAINPRTEGRTGIGSANTLYEHFGIDMSDADADEDGDVTDEEALDAVGSSPLLVFGLGESCSMVGAVRGGVETAPRYDVLPYTNYRQYLLVVRITGSTATTFDSGAEYAGVLNPEGQTINEARFDNEWRSGNRY